MADSYHVSRVLRRGPGVARRERQHRHGYRRYERRHQQPHER